MTPPSGWNMTGSGPNEEHPGDDTYTQTKSIFQKFKDLLDAAGGKMNDIMSITVYVTNLDENTEVWRARREFFTGDFPCSTLIEVKRVGSPKASPPILIRISCDGQPAVAVSDQIRAVAKERLRSRLGTVAAEEMTALEDGLRQIMQLG